MPLLGASIHPWFDHYHFCRRVPPVLITYKQTKPIQTRDKTEFKLNLCRKLSKYLVNKLRQNPRLRKIPDLGIGIFLQHTPGAPMIITVPSDSRSVFRGILYLSCISNSWNLSFGQYLSSLVISSLSLWKKRIKRYSAKTGPMDPGGGHCIFSIKSGTTGLARVVDKLTWKIARER